VGGGKRRVRLTGLTGFACALAAAWLVPEVAAKQGAYVSSFENGTIAAGRVAADGEIDPIAQSPIPTGAGSLEGIAVSADGKGLYTAALADLVYAFEIRRSGALAAPDGGATQPVGPGGAYGIVPTPNGKYVYVAANGDDRLRGYRIRKGRGLKELPEATAEVELPTGLAVSPDGRHLYALAATDAPGRIHAFRIAADGGLDPIAGSPYETGPAPYALAFTPDGEHLYVADRGIPAFLHAYAIAGNGRPSELAGSPYPADGDNPFGMAISPDGRALYTANFGSDTISGFAIGADGALADLPGSVYPAPQSPAAIGFNAYGFRMYVVAGNDSMGIYDVESDGVPTNMLLSLFGSLGDFQSIALTPAQPPKARLKARVDGDEVKLSARRSTDDGRIIEYHWNFGDGKRQTLQGAKTTHFYEKPGRYRVSVRLTDDDGCSKRYVSTGQTAYCNGGKRAVASKRIRIKKLG